MRKVIIIAALLISLISQSWGQTVVILEPSAPGCVPINITLGSEYTFKRGTGCAGRFLAITDRAGSLKMETAQDSLDYTFDEVGIFDVYCDVPSGVVGGSAVNFAVACYNVQAINTVPTMGEWGLICLGVILMIFSVQAIMQKNQSFSTLSE